LHFITTSLNNRRQLHDNSLRPIPFVKLVQNILVGNYECIMGICGKIFIINLHNLQMLFMLWIEYKFSECLAPCTNMKIPDGRLSGDGSTQAHRHRGL